MPMWVLIAAAALLVLGLLALQDITQKEHAVRRVYPLIGRLRYITERFGPELRQYIVTSDLEERPFTRIQRSWVYQSAKGVNNAVGFGTQHDTSHPGAFHFLPSPYATLDREAPLLALPPHVIGPDRARPFPVRTRVNIAPMSFGALSGAAVRALALGAARAGMYINTGEGGLSSYHLVNGGDVIFQLGPAKYGARTPDGQLDWERLAEIGRMPQVRAIEIKLGQGAKPGKGGILPAVKVTPEIARMRGIEPHKASYSPNRFEEYEDFPSLLDFVERVRAAVPVPVGIKIAIGDPVFADQLAQELARSGRGPDYVSVDGSEGGTGAAPPSLSDHMALPLADALSEVDNAYRRHGVRDRITLIAAGRITNGAEVAFALALGADLVNVARGFMMSLGCIQALRCHTNECPTGVTTQHAWRQRGLVPEDKAVRVANYAHALQDDLMTVVRACGLRSPAELTREHFEVIIEVGRRMRGSQLYPYPPAVFPLRAAPAAAQLTDVAASG